MKRYKMFKLKTFSSERIKVKTMLNFVAGLSSDKTVLIFFADLSCVQQRTVKECE